MGDFLNDFFVNLVHRLFPCKDPEIGNLGWNKLAMTNLCTMFGID